ncbi:MAG: hypothetical protein JWO94_2363, partial [Verrucomicrobiaceae bacterium]|nr:hypothetical protein [Verrucomicrobiaceae bacterium]
MWLGANDSAPFEKDGPPVDDPELDGESRRCFRDDLQFRGSSPDPFVAKKGFFDEDLALPAQTPDPVTREDGTVEKPRRDEFSKPFRKFSGPASVALLSATATSSAPSAPKAAETQPEAPKVSSIAEKDSSLFKPIRKYPPKQRRRQEVEIQPFKSEPQLVVAEVVLVPQASEVQVEPLPVGPDVEARVFAESPAEASPALATIPLIELPVERVVIVEEVQSQPVAAPVVEIINKALVPPVGDETPPKLEGGEVCPLPAAVMETPALPPREECADESADEVKASLPPKKSVTVIGALERSVALRRERDLRSLAG